MMDDISYIISSQYRRDVIGFLIKKDVATPTKIADATAIRTNHISKVLSELKNKEIVECINEDARKGKLYKITEKGKKLYNKIIEYEL